MRRFLMIIAVLVVASCNVKVSHPLIVEEAPAIFPDYVGVTVPATIAPLNFCMKDESVRRMDVVIEGSAGGDLHIRGRNTVEFPSGRWRELLEANRGETLKVNVSALYGKQWKSYNSFDISISDDDIDDYIVYRLISPSYGTVGQIGLYQREISSFRQESILESREFNSCFNCHAFRKCEPDMMTLHVRGPQGGTLINTSDNGLRIFNTKTDSTISNCAYPYWHPSGRYIAYSTNRTAQGYHQRPDKMLEVYDSESDVNVYDIEKNELISAPCVSSPGMLESFPVFSADGKTLYFTCAKAQEIPAGITEIRYNLCKVGFDPETGRIGDVVDTVISAASAGKSVTVPKPSYDGRYIMYSLADYGTFAVWHPESDLWLMDLMTGETTELKEANSWNVECSHSWSSNSRWFTFGSRRDNGLFTYLYICHLDADGKCAKPFLLPQRHPGEFYDNLMKSFNIPEFTSGAVRLDRDKAVHDLSSGKRVDFIFHSSY